MYTKLIKYEKHHPLFGWVAEMFRTTDDAIWSHLQTMSLRTDIRKVVVSDI